MVQFSRKAVQALKAYGADGSIVAGLIVLDVIARLLPHAPNFTPVAASALFAATVLRRRTLALAVPFLGMALSDAVLGSDAWPVTVVVYAAIALPGAVAVVSRRLRAPAWRVPVILSGSLVFFAATNFAVWAFSGIYAGDLAGLTKCYIAALPFLKNTVGGDLFWAAILFGGAWLARRAPAWRGRETAAVA